MKLKLLSGEMSAVTFIWVFLFHLIAAGEKMLLKKNGKKGVLSNAGYVILEWNHYIWTEIH